MKSRLQTRLAAAMFVLCALSTVTAMGATAVLWLRGHREAVNEQLQASATALLSLGISDFTELADFERLDTFIEDALQMERVNRIIRVYDAHRRLLFSSVQVAPPELNLPAGPIVKPVLETLSVQSGDFQSLAIPYRSKGMAEAFYLQVLMPLPKAADILKNLWWEGLVLFAVLTLFSLAISRLLAKRLLKPVSNIGEYLEGMDPKDIEHWRPLPMERDAYYLRAISEGINRLIERTRASVLQTKKMSRFVAHEMRTPLTILQGEAENTLAQAQAGKAEYEKTLRSSLEEIQRMSEIVATVLEIGGTPGVGGELPARDLDLALWVGENLDPWRERLGRPIAWQKPDGKIPTVRAEERLLFRLVDNLWRNVGVHTPQDAACRIEVRGESGAAVLAVEDRGPGMAAAARESLNREGRLSDYAGIGLNLCLTIAQNCGWTLQFLPVDPHGLRIEIRFSV